MKKIQAKKIRIVNEKTLMVTADIGKVRNTGYCRCPDGTELNPFEFSNHGLGFEKLWDFISRIKADKDLQEVVFGFESTGPYAEPLIHYLRNKGVRVVQVNPMHTKRLKELNGNSPSKTDQKDPKVIADIIKLGHSLTVIIPEGPAAELRRLTQARERSMQRRTAFLNQLQDLIFIIFPEFSQVVKNVKTKSAQYLLKHYPTPQDIAGCGIKKLFRILKKISRGKLREGCAEALYEAAKTSVGIKEGRASILLEIKEILAQIEACERFIANLEREMSLYLKEIPYSSYILSLKGIGEVTAAGIIGEAGDFSKFDTASEIEKLAGLDLFEISSGKHKGQRHISKRGRPLLRKLLFFASINVVRKEGILHEQYQRYLQRGMLKMKAIVAISRKLLRIIYALVRNNSNYVFGYTKTQNLLSKEAA